MSGLQGMARQRKLIRQLPDALRAELGNEIKETGAELLIDMRVAAPFRTGRLRRAITMRYLPRTLRVMVGLVGKKANRDLFYGRILHWGRKSRVKQVTRRRGRTVIARGKQIRGKPTYLIHIPALPPRKFVIKPRPDLWRRFSARLKAKWSSILRRASGG